MAKQKTQTSAAPVVGASLPTSPAAKTPVDKKTDDTGEGEDASPSAETPLSVGVLLRRSCIDGIWYPHGALIKASASLCQALSEDGAMDLHPAAVEHALANSAPQLVHTTPEAGAE